MRLSRLSSVCLAALATATACSESVRPLPDPGAVRVAATLPQTGYLSADGAKVRDGYLLAVEMLNEQGGVDGREVELVLRDDGSDAAAAARLYGEFAADETVDALLGPYSSAVTEAVLPVTEAASTPLIAGLASSAEIWAGKDRRWTVQMLNPATTFLQGPVELAAAGGAETVALVWEDSRFPASVAEGVRAAAARAGLRLALDLSYPPGAADHAMLARAAKRAGADLFLGAGYSDDATELVRATSAAGYRPQLMGLALGSDDPGFAGVVGPLARCVTGHTPWVASGGSRGPLADSETFARRFQEKHGRPPGFHEAGAFGTVELLSLALAEALTPLGVDNEVMRDFLFSVRRETVLGPYGVAPLGSAAAGSQQLLAGLQVQWQDDGQGGLTRRVVHPAGAAQAAPCFSRAPGPIRVAASFPETGRFREDGGKMRDGYVLGVAMANEQGGVGGRLLELQLRDDQSNPQLAASRYRQFLADPSIDVLLGPYASPVTEAVLPVTEAASKPLITAMAASTGLWEGRERQWSVQMLNSAQTYLQGSVELAAAAGAETVALVWENTSFPRAVAEGVRSAAAAAGMRVVLDRSYPGGGAQHRALAEAAKTSAADLLIGGGYFRDAIDLTKAVGAVGYVPKLTSWSIGPADPRFADSVGAAARCVAGNAPWVATVRTRGRIADSQMFVRRFEEAHGALPGYHAAGGFGAVELLTAALEGSLAPTGELDETAMRDFLFGADTQTVLGPFQVAPLGSPAAGSQVGLRGLQIQWQDDGRGGFTQKIVHPADVADAEVCFHR